MEKALNWSIMWLVPLDARIVTVTTCQTEGIPNSRHQSTLYAYTYGKLVALMVSQLTLKCKRLCTVVSKVFLAWLPEWEIDLKTGSASTVEENSAIDDTLFNRSMRRALENYGAFRPCP